MIGSLVSRTSLQVGVEIVHVVEIAHIQSIGHARREREKPFTADFDGRKVKGSLWTGVLEGPVFLIRRFVHVLQNGFRWHWPFKVHQWREIAVPIKSILTIHAPSK